MFVSGNLRYQVKNGATRLVLLLGVLMVGTSACTVRKEDLVGLPIESVAPKSPERMKVEAEPGGLACYLYADDAMFSLAIAKERKCAFISTSLWTDSYEYQLQRCRSLPNNSSRQAELQAREDQLGQCPYLTWRVNIIPNVHPKQGLRVIDGYNFQALEDVQLYFNGTKQTPVNADASRHIGPLPYASFCTGEHWNVLAHGNKSGSNAEAEVVDCTCDPLKGEDCSH